VIPSESATPSTLHAPPSAATSIDTPAQAVTALRGLVEVARRPYRSGYQRACSRGAACSFGPAWTDDNNSEFGHNSCSTRDDVLAEQLRDVQRLPGSRCVVVAGILHDPYTGATIAFSKSRAYLVPLDHVVPLELAWHLGAAGWEPAAAGSIMPTTPLVLLAVDEAQQWAEIGECAGGVDAEQPRLQVCL